jgi:hypothetical protein
MRLPRILIVAAIALLSIYAGQAIVAAARTDDAPPESVWNHQPPDAPPQATSGDEVGDGTVSSVGIQATRRITIPYGFETPLPVLDDGRDVVASGHGGCTVDEQVTVAITITQSTSGAMATGQKVQTCTGELQTWSFAVTADTTPYFADGPAEACGLATTRDAGYVTDTYDWCKDVDLINLNHYLYLPAALKP